MDATDLIKRFSLARQDRPDCEFYCGVTEDISDVERALVNDPGWFHEGRLHSNQQPITWICLRDRLILGYAEGDLHLLVFSNTPVLGFYQCLHELAEFYGKT